MESTQSNSALIGVAAFIVGIIVGVGGYYVYLTYVSPPSSPTYIESSSPDWEAVFGEPSEEKINETLEEPGEDYSNPFKEETEVTQEEISDEEYVNPFDALGE